MYHSSSPPTHTHTHTPSSLSSQFLPVKSEPQEQQKSANRSWGIDVCRLTMTTQQQPISTSSSNSEEVDRRSLILVINAHCAVSLIQAGVRVTLIDLLTTVPPLIPRCTLALIVQEQVLEVWNTMLTQSKLQ